MNTPEQTAGTNLYLVALLFPEGVNEKIRIIQREISQDFGFKKSLSKPVHITLIPPFKATAAVEKGPVFQQVADLIHPFKIVLRDFSCFPNPKNPVLFVHLEDNPELLHLFRTLQRIWEETRSAQVIWTKHFTPHVTVAYRDTEPAKFRDLWARFKDRVFDAAFMQENFTLLRMDNGAWTPVHHFSFAKK